MTGQSPSRNTRPIPPNRSSGQWSWQRDFFDVGNATSLFIEMIKAEALSEGMKRRMERAGSGELLPGHYRLGSAPAGLWD